MSDVSIHPSVDDGLKPGAEGFVGGVLVCACAERPVKVEVRSPVAHNHACGCTQCWKPQGALFSVVAIAPSAAVTVKENGDKLKVVDPSAVILRHACTECGVHMHGPVEQPGHPFTGLSFVHPERFEAAGAPPPSFAAFVSSIIESGVHPSRMDAVRARLRELSLPPYDCLNPPLMDYIATFTAMAHGVLKTEA